MIKNLSNCWPLVASALLLSTSTATAVDMSCPSVKVRFDFFAGFVGFTGLQLPAGDPPFAADIGHGNLEGWISCNADNFLEEIDLCIGGVVDEELTREDADRFKDVLKVMFAGVHSDALDHASRLANEAAQNMVSSEQIGMNSYGQATLKLDGGYTASVNATTVHGMGHLSLCARVARE